MKSFRLLIALTAVAAATPSISFSQDSLVTKIASKNMMTFSVDKETFSGKGWTALVNQIRKSDFVLVGEDHFTNEIPFFTSAISDQVKFDNFICEVDPYSTDIIASKIRTLSALQLKNYVADFGNVFSFYALEPEFQLLKKLVNKNTSIYGLDQVLMNADRLICNDLKRTTKNKKASEIYEGIEQKSKAHFSDFLKDPSKPMYMMTDDFEKQVALLLALKLSADEKRKIEAMKLSAKIYKEQNHHLRVQLMKHNLMDLYPKWVNKKNLFKYGAGHIPKGESFLKIYDIGSLVDNIADSQFKSSLPILIIGKSGFQGSPFKGFPQQTVDENSDDLKVLKPLFNAVEGDQWYYFDMVPIRKALENGEIVVTDIGLLRIIKGFDVVVIIPKVSASTFPTTE